ncbi:hypothetical protein [Ruminococcus flavefaciens]|uniref:hypothetical protein n=1 Tax=Ruminococcus flavefaciens TaxID=1265 RepID=UPI0025D466D2|nr:hypothetical protein [Ruminococcus flavefaciens]
MAEFVSKALDDELHPKTTIKEEKYMGNMRTMAFQIPSELFDQIKDYLDRHHMTQKQFVLGLIQDELDRDYEEQQAMAEKQSRTSLTVTMRNSRQWLKSSRQMMSLTKMRMKTSMKQKTKTCLRKTKNQRMRTKMKTSTNPKIRKNLRTRECLWKCEVFR